MPTDPEAPDTAERLSSFPARGPIDQPVEDSTGCGGCGCEAGATDGQMQPATETVR